MVKIHAKKRKMKELFKCNDSREVTEYIGMKVDVDKEQCIIRLTQPVMIKSFEDKFGMTKNGKITTPSVPGKVLQKCQEKDKLSKAEHKKYCVSVQMVMARHTEFCLRTVKVRSMSRN